MTAGEEHFPDQGRNIGSLHQDKEVMEEKRDSTTNTI
jgi:hypothetical protein